MFVEIMGELFFVEFVWLVGPNKWSDKKAEEGPAKKDNGEKQSDDGQKDGLVDPAHSENTPFFSYVIRKHCSN